LCRKLPSYADTDFASALHTEAAFLLNVHGNSIAVSTWVSPKRTRSYPYARVYNTLSHSGKKVTIIPFVKDEGLAGDRDFIQWDTISLMSLLDIHVIIAYYSKAEKNILYANKITHQKFDAEFIYSQIYRLLSYQSSALHWNIEQINTITDSAELSKSHYVTISQETGVALHAMRGIDKRIKMITNSKDDFMLMSRGLSQSAQKREIQTIQPKEYITKGLKARLNITNYLGGIYYLTSDEVAISGTHVYIIEGKHTKSGTIPSLDDIKDGLLKMILYTNLKDIVINRKTYIPIPVLKLTSGTLSGKAEPDDYSAKKQIDTLLEEAKLNNFKVSLPWGNDGRYS
jgi:hypothetical protein